MNINMTNYSQHELRTAAAHSLVLLRRNCARQEIVRRFIADEFPHEDDYADLEDMREEEISDAYDRGFADSESACELEKRND